MSENKERLKQYFERANKYVSDLENKPEQRMMEVLVGDEVCFLKGLGEYNDDGEEMFSFGHGVVVGIEDKTGKRHDSSAIKNVELVHVTSESYPFNITLEKRHILKNYTYEKANEVPKK